jgi:chromosome segregation ATPase
MIPELEEERDELRQYVHNLNERILKAEDRIARINKRLKDLGHHVGILAGFPYPLPCTDKRQ